MNRTFFEALKEACLHEGVDFKKFFGKVESKK